MKRTLLAVIALALPATIQAADNPHAGHEHHDHAAHQAMLAAPANVSSADVKLLDSPMLNQHGKPVKFKTDVVGQDIVVMDFVYTTCTTVCPVLSSAFEKVQTQLGASAGKTVRLVSVTIDPVRDTPQRLKAYAAKHKAGGGWTWVTGQPPVVDEVLRGLGAYTASFTDHPPMVLVGDARSGQWTRFVGFVSAEDIIGQVNKLLVARGGAPIASAAKKE